jgi:hypothetical protein
MSASHGGVVARLGVVLVLTTIAEAGAKSGQKNKKERIVTVWPGYTMIISRLDSNKFITWNFLIPFDMHRVVYKYMSYNIRLLLQPSASIR